MTNPRHAKDANDGRGRLYAVPGYEHIEFTSVTNYCGILNKPAIAPASAKRAGERAVFQEDAWHAIQQEQGDEAARKWISAAPREYMKYASALGSAVHYAIESGAEMTPEVTSRCMWWWEKDAKAWEPDAEKFVARVASHLVPFAEFMQTSGARIVAQERTVFSPEHAYAGTLDAILEIGGKNYLTDWKTGFVSHESVPMQLAAYRHATHYIDGDTTREMEHEIHGGLVLNLKPRSYKAFWVDCGHDAFDAFLHAKRMWHWVDSGCKTALKEWRG